MSDQWIIKKITKLKKALNAVILAHNYQTGEIQKIADFLGDSLGLSRNAAASDADIIVFCGVHFMAETAAILSPEKMVLIPEPSAGCPMADMITAGDLRAMKAEHPGAITVAYVNSSAEIKAETDICCTSANAAEVVKSIPEDREVIFVPDRYLGSYVTHKTGRELILFPGYCPVHRLLKAETLENQKRVHPRARVMVHPECTPEVIALADDVLSTSGMERTAAGGGDAEFIIGTEVDMVTRLRRDNPGKKFYPAFNQMICHDMKKITLEKVLRSLEEKRFQVTVPEEIREKALRSVNAMIGIG